MPSVNLAGLKPISIAIGTAIKIPAMGQRNTCSTEQSGNLSVKVLLMVAQGLGNNREQRTGQMQAFKGKCCWMWLIGAVGSITSHNTTRQPISTQLAGLDMLHVGKNTRVYSS